MFRQQLEMLGELVGRVDFHRARRPRALHAVGRPDCDVECILLHQLAGELFPGGIRHRRLLLHARRIHEARLQLDRRILGRDAFEVSRRRVARGALSRPVEVGFAQLRVAGQQLLEVVVARRTQPARLVDFSDAGFQVADDVGDLGRGQRDDRHPFVRASFLDQLRDVRALIVPADDCGEEQIRSVAARGRWSMAKAARLPELLVPAVICLSCDLDAGNPQTRTEAQQVAAAALRLSDARAQLRRQEHKREHRGRDCGCEPDSPHASFLTGLTGATGARLVAHTLQSSPPEMTRACRRRVQARSSRSHRPGSGPDSLPIDLRRWS